MLSVDGPFLPPTRFETKPGGQGQINKPLYLGGHPKDTQSNKYLGCIRNVEITSSDKQIETFKKFPADAVKGNVTLSVCPTI